jgi:hypothetical protein
LGIGGTTAIFTMIQAVMLRSLPVSDPALLYRIGDGDDCCVNRFFRRGEDSLGQHFGLDLPANAGTFRVVGIVHDAKYGVTAYTVAQRTNEIGIRMALGADRTKVVRYILRGAFVRVAAGLVLGIPLAIAAGRLISSQLYDVSFWDPLALAVAAAALAICALVAALIPASFADSISPMTALRTE